MRQSFHQEDLPLPPSLAKPSSSRLVITMDAQIAALIQQTKVLMEAVHSLQQQQIQQQQQPPMEEPVAHSVPSRHSHRPPRCHPLHLQNDDHLGALIESCNHVLGILIMPLILHDYLILLLIYIVSRRKRGRVYLLLFHLRVLQGILPLDFFSNNDSTTT